jgi:hypothetical protein
LRGEREVTEKEIKKEKDSGWSQKNTDFGVNGFILENKIQWRWFYFLTMFKKKKIRLIKYTYTLIFHIDF